MEINNYSDDDLKKLMEKLNRVKKGKRLNKIPKSGIRFF